MATPADKLAQFLTAPTALQDGGIVAIRAMYLTRVHRERLLKQGFIREVLKGGPVCSISALDRAIDRKGKTGFSESSRPFQRRLSEYGLPL